MMHSSEAVGSTVSRVEAVGRQFRKTNWSRWTPWIVGLAVLVVVGWGIWIPGLWYDEAVTVSAAERSLPALGALLARVDAVHGLYYSVMHLWFGLVDYSPLTLRVPSAFAVAATSVLLVRLGTMQWGLSAGVAAGLVYGLIPRTLWMATQGRSYALAAFLVTLAVFFFVRALSGARRRDWAFFSASMAVASAAFLYTLLLVAVFVVVVLIQRVGRRQWTDFLASPVGVAAVTAPLALLALSQRSQIAWITLVTLRQALRSPYFVYLEGATSLPIVIGWAALLGVTLALLLISKAGGRALNRPAGVVLAIGWFGFPLVALLVIGSILPLYSNYYPAFATPGLALAMGAGIGGLTSPRARAALLVVTALLAVQPWVFHRSPNSKTDMLDVVGIVAANRGSGGAVWFVEGSTWVTPRQLSVGYPEAFAGLADITLDEDASQSATFFGTSKPLSDVESSLGEYDRLLAVVHGPTETLPSLQEGMDDLATAGLTKAGTEATGQWTVYIFERA